MRYGNQSLKELMELPVQETVEWAKNLGEFMKFIKDNLSV